MNVSSSSSSSTDYSRITGLATGMDTDAMVKQAVAGDQAKIDSVNQSKQTLQWQQEAYVDIIKDLKGFYDSYIDILGSNDTSMMKSSTYAGVTATSNNPTKLTATPSGGAVKGDYLIEVTQKALTAKKQSIAFSGTTQNSALSSLGLTNGNAINISVNGEAFTFTIDNTKTVSDFVTSLKTVTNSNGKTLGNLANISFSELTGKFSIETKDTGSTQELNISGQAAIELGMVAGQAAKKESLVFSNATGTSILNEVDVLNDSSLNTPDSITITVNEGTFDVVIDPTNNINALIDSVKNATIDGKTLGDFVNVSFNESTGKLLIETKKIGSSETLSISGNLADKLGIATSIIYGSGNVGTDAIVNITAPGEQNSAQVTKSSNKFTIDNITYDLSAASNGDTATLTVKADATAQVDKFKKFVEKYNELIEKINTKITEKKNYSYKPLTDTQKESMKDEEITKWEEQAKKGLLARDSNLSNLLLQVRQTFYSTVEGAGITLSEIGISTTSNYRDGGKLQIDETKLKDALENKGDLVQKLFTQNSSNANEKGILQRVKDTLNNYIGSDGLLIKKAGYTNSRWAYDNQLSKSIESKNTTIKDLQRRLYDKQERYYKMFAALEKNMNNLNSQSNWLYSQLGTA